MTRNAEEWRRLRSEFIEAAVKYEEYETFIERTAHSEERYYNSGRYFPVGLIRWPYKPLRKCWILAPDSGTNEEPFSTMKTLFSKAWLWLPRVIADEVVDTAEMHLSEPPSPPSGTELFWANSHYQYWGWLLWFHWLRQLREANPTEADKPSQKIVLAPFHCSGDLIAQWGLDGSDGTIPEWLADPAIDRKGAGSDVGRPGGVTTEPAGLTDKPAAEDEEARPEDAEIAASAIEAERGRLSDVELPIERDDDEANRNQPIPSDFDKELQNALEAHGIRPEVAETLSPEQKRNIIMAHWSDTPAKTRDRWQETNWRPSLGKESKTRLGDKVKTYIKRGKEKLGKLASEK